MVLLHPIQVKGDHQVVADWTPSRKDICRTQFDAIQYVVERTLNKILRFHVKPPLRLDPRPGKEKQASQSPTGLPLL
jgi:hypothetical protein